MHSSSECGITRDGVTKGGSEKCRSKSSKDSGVTNSGRDKCRVGISQAETGVTKSDSDKGRAGQSIA